MQSNLRHPDLNNQDAVLVSVIIVNWNGAAVLPRCLDSLKKQTYQNFELIIVDNGSTDRSWVSLDEKWPGLKLIRLPENRGFAAANNKGVREASGEWIAFLNSDAFPEPDWLTQFVNAAQQHSKFNFFSSTLVQADNQLLLDGTGDIYHTSGLAWRRHYNQPLKQISEDVEEVFSPCAAAALYQRMAFLHVGGFDEEYFMYHEDVDLGFRLRLQGFRCLYVPKAVVHHLGSASTSLKSDFVVYHGHRNLVWSYFQNMPGRLPPLEGMACGTPVITSDISSMPEFVGDAGILVPPNDEAALSRAILQVLEDDDLRKRLQELGPQRAANFTWKHTAEKTLEIYQQVLSA